MRYQKFFPSAQLMNFVECYFIWEGQTETRKEVQSPPSCYGAIVFNYGDPTWAYQNSSDLTLVPDGFICGLFTSNYHRILNGKIGMAGIVLRATAIHNFFGIRMSTLVNSRMPLEFLLGTQASRLLQEIRTGSSDEERILTLQNLMLTYLAQGKQRLSIIDEAVELIEQMNGNLSIDEVASRLRISKRYLEKQFLSKVGVSPKFFSRLKRFGMLSNKIAHNEKIDWQEIVSEYGFHDQSHLIKEFLEFNQTNPTHYHQYHQEMTRYIKQAVAGK
jgi:AraC-like DNA-binding protein